MVQAKLNQGMSDLEALKLGFQTILTAPGFLYLKEGTGELDEYALASRLSYFLWSSMPDEKLINLAEQGKLKQSSVLEEQIERMLSDAKGMRFVENFLRVWLELDNIGKMPPHPKNSSAFTGIIWKLLCAKRRKCSLIMF